MVAQRQTSFRHVAFGDKTHKQPSLNTEQNTIPTRALLNPEIYESCLNHTTHFGK